MKIIEKVKNVLTKILNIMKKPDMLVLPGQLAFFFLLAIVPTVTLIAYGISFFNLSYSAISNFITNAFGSEITQLLVPMVEEMQITPAFLITILISFYTASTGASSIIITSNQLYNLKNTRFIKRKIKAIIMTFILVILFVFLMLVPVFGNKLIELIKLLTINKNVTNTLIFIINLTKGPISWLLTFFLIKIIYSIAPDENIPSTYTTKGALVSAIGFIIATNIYSFFVNNFAHYDVMYGGLAHFVVLMIWLYLIATIVTISLAINSEELENGKNRYNKKSK